MRLRDGELNHRHRLEAREHEWFPCFVDFYCMENGQATLYNNEIPKGRHSGAQSFSGAMLIFPIQAARVLTGIAPPANGTSLKQHRTAGRH